MENQNQKQKEKTLILELRINNYSAAKVNMQKPTAFLQIKNKVEFEI